MAITLRSVMPQSREARERWDALGLSDALDQCIDGDEVRNEWPSEHGDSSGEIFATLEDYQAPDGHTYHVLFTTDWSNSWSPWTDTRATLYRTDDPEDMVEFRADVAEWEAKPEYDPDYQGDDEESDQGYWRIVTPQGVACVDADLVPAIEPTPQDFLPHLPDGHRLPDYDSGDPADSWQYEYHEGPIPDSESQDS